MNTTSQTSRAAAIAIATALALTGIALSPGCSSKLETGYQPRLLGSSPETRRGYYAQPFTPEAKKAKQYEQDYGTPTGSNAVRPRPGD